jgi:anti-sigma regulatory factor (Ser/Thr protein kinase)
MEVVVALNEAVINTLVHGYAGRPGMVEVEVRRRGAAIVVRLRDRGPAYDPTQAGPPDVTGPLHERPAGGLGVYLMSRFVDELTYRRTEDGENELSLVKRDVADE